MAIGKNKIKTSHTVSCYKYRQTRLFFVMNDNFFHLNQEAPWKSQKHCFQRTSTWMNITMCLSGFFKYVMPSIRFSPKYHAFPKSTRCTNSWSCGIGFHAQNKTRAFFELTGWCSRKSQQRQRDCKHGHHSGEDVNKKRIPKAFC